MTRSLAQLDRAGRRRMPVAGPRVRLGAASLVAAMLVLLTAAPGMLAQAPDAASKLRLTAAPLLGGTVRPGEWAAVRVHLENDGPAVDGELRIASSESGASTYGIAVQLATGARQDHLLYGKTGFFGARFTIDLVSDGTTVVGGHAAVESIDPESLGIHVVAERPERLLSDIRGSAAARSGQPATVGAIQPEDLPPRMEAWAAVDRLVWQDVSAARLSTEQLDALRTWVALGGELVILGGSTGVGSLDGFPDELLPYRPAGIVDVALDDLGDLLGSLPADATPLPALAGPLQRGVALAQSGGQAIAARLSHGQGSVTLVGIDPAADWLGGSPVAAALWTRVMPAGVPSPGRGREQDDGALLDALSYLPSVAIPRMDHLFLLFLGYVILLGPVSYLVLRRLDRREWAWFTIPALAVTFTAAAFVLGIVLKGSDVVVNELGVVRGAAGTDRGLADVYVGVFSPSRSTFDVRVPGGAFLSEPDRDRQRSGERPLDVLLGDPARLRGLQVGFGDLRGFRAEATVATPRVEADLKLVGDRLVGTITNASDGPLDHVSVAYGGGLQVLGGMAAGATSAVDVTPGSAVVNRRSLARLMFEDSSGDASAPVSAARLSILRSLSDDGGFDGEATADPLSAYGPLILAWRTGGALDVDVGVAAERVGDTLYLLPVTVAVAGPVSFTGGTVRHSVIGTEALEAYDDSSEMYLARGSMTVAYRPADLEGAFEVSGLSLRLAQRLQAPATDGEVLVALPDAEQPDQDDPLSPGPDLVTESLPRVQLFDRVARRWVEFQPMKQAQSYEVTGPERYVDAFGGVLVRFVSRGSDGTSFVLGVRIDGTVP